MRGLTPFKYLADLMRAEETVTVKQVRLPRQQAELASLINDAVTAYHEAHNEWSRIIEAAPKQAAHAFRDLLLASQFDPEIPKVEKATPIVVEAIRPLALAEKLDDHLHEAWCAANITTDSQERRVVGLQTSIKWFDKVLSGYDELVDEDKRMAAACEAYRKALIKS